MIFDTNILIALIENKGGPDFLERLTRHRAGQTVRINEIVFAELSSQYESAENLETVLAAIGVECVWLTLAECHRAGQAFAEYRQRGGQRTAILSDFLIGAQAATRGWPLVTRDRKGFDSYFPEITIIDPLEDQA